eukprot:8238198-Pyramimonas_sp.AAC.1
MPPLQTPLRWEMMARPGSSTACLPSRSNGPSPRCWGAICTRPPMPLELKPALIAGAASEAHPSRRSCP